MIWAWKRYVLLSGIPSFKSSGLPATNLMLANWDTFRDTLWNSIWDTFYIFGDTIWDTPYNCGDTMWANICRIPFGNRFETPFGIHPIYFWIPLRIIAAYHLGPTPPKFFVYQDNRDFTACNMEMSTYMAIQLCSAPMPPRCLPMCLLICSRK